MKTKRPKFTARQGDVWIEEVDALPKQLKRQKAKDGRIILAGNGEGGQLDARTGRIIQGLLHSSAT